MPNLLVKGVSEAINRSKAVVVYNCNLMTKLGHTDGYGVADFVRVIERYIGEGRVDYVTCNDKIPERELLDRYADQGEYAVAMPSDPSDQGFAGKVLSTNLISSRVYAQKSGDPIRRTLIRHDPDVLATLIVQNCLGGL